MVSHARDLFTKSFGSDPQSVSRAPGRVEVLGNHTDYNEGYVLSCSIDRAVFAAASRSSDEDGFGFVSSQFPEVVRVGDPARKSEQKWIAYPLGVYAVLKQGGYPVGPFRLAVHGDIPIGGGLSSSAALEVSTALCLGDLFGFEIEPVDMAKICQRAENEFVGANCGLLDQFSSLLAEKNRLLFIDFRSLSYRTIPLPADNICVAVTMSGVTHTLAESAYNDRRRECAAAADYFASVNPNVKTLRDVTMDMIVAHQDRLEPDTLKRARHVVGENERVLSGIGHLEQGALREFGRILYRSHESSRLNFENSCDELDTLVGIARTVEGVYGSRLTGGGFGGATLAILDIAAKERFEKTIIAEYKKATGRDTVVHFASVAEGAGMVNEA
ncbi:MAG: galactokinase [Chitinivibrionales bacterium]|nr:galactokinase [Chitinivibrionales bacterium]MBD3394671.1 galactokinase [Chitinivibrionales bacterium]